MELEQEPIQIHIDRFGRVVIPQHLREALHLTPGKKLEVAMQSDQTIVLKVIAEDVPVTDKEGWLVVDTQAPEADIVSSIKSDRQKRDKKLGGSSD